MRLAQLGFAVLSLSLLGHCFVVYQMVVSIMDASAGHRSKKGIDRECEFKAGLAYTENPENGAAPAT